MKKSFKKAGAAVLSMAMLLSMGAVSMPTYAVSDNDYKPGQILVKLNTQFADDGTGTTDYDAQTTTPKTVNHIYDYIPNVTNAKVSLYRVATLGTNGWSWDIPNMTTAESDLSYTAMDGTTINVSDFADLLKTMADANTPSKQIPIASSQEMLALASKLERLIVTNHNAYASTASEYIAPIAEGNITSSGQQLLLPTDSDAYAKTRNVVGYYLIVTDTSDAGVTVQPALVVLQNKDSTNTDDHNPVEVSLKGTEINIDKSIVTVKDSTDDVVTAGTSTTKGEPVASTGDTAVVAKNDEISYNIHAQLPKYDANVTGDNITTFTIVDTPDKGINILDNNSGSYSVKDIAVKYAATSSDTATALDASKYTVTPLPYGAIKAQDGTDASGKAKYTYTPIANVTAYNTAVTDGKTVVGYNGFMVQITGTNMKTLQNGFVDVSFTGTVDETLNRKYYDVTPSKTASDVTDANITTDANLGDIGITTAPTDSVTTENDALAAWETILTTNATVASTLGLTAESDDTAIKAAVNAYKGTLTKVTAATNLTDVNKFENVVKAIAYLTKANADIATANETNAAKNGNKNIADMYFGNDYATGGGLGQDSDTTKVFSVDLDLYKVVQDNKIVHGQSGVEDAENTTDWTDVTEEKPVSGAVFKLDKDYAVDGANSTTVAKKHNVGYAATGADGHLIELSELTKSGSNWVLTNSDGTTTNVADDSEDYTIFTWTEKDDENNDVTKKAVYSNTVAQQKKAWIELTIGEYTLTEVFSPAGYKKWDSAVKFNVEATKDNNDYTGKFGATAGQGYSAVAKDRRADKTTGEAYYFDFTGADGELDTTVINKYADNLPATGGIGTVLFTAGGISVVLIAGALFVMYMKKRNAEDEE